MTITNPISNSRTSTARPTTGPVLALAGALAATLTAAAMLQPSIPREAWVPAAATLLFVFAAAIALIAWLRPTPHRHFTYWDAAGVLTFIGICAAATVEPEQMVQLVAGAERPR
jgi:drug/metabolite transporter (DMT)-like permease